MKVYSSILLFMFAFFVFGSESPEDLFIKKYRSIWKEAELAFSDDLSQLPVVDKMKELIDKKNIKDFKEIGIPEWIFCYLLSPHATYKRSENQYEYRIVKNTKRFDSNTLLSLRRHGLLWETDCPDYALQAFHIESNGQENIMLKSFLFLKKTKSSYKIIYPRIIDNLRCKNLIIKQMLHGDFYNFTFMVPSENETFSDFFYKWSKPDVNTGKIVFSETFDEDGKLLERVVGPSSKIEKIDPTFYAGTYNKPYMVIHYNNDGTIDTKSFYEKYENLFLEKSYINEKLHEKSLCENGEELRKIYYISNGKTHWGIPYKKGEKQGLAKAFHKNGKIKHERNYNKGLLEGMAKEYDANGNIIWETMFLNDIKEGLETQYDSKGNIINKFVWKNGKLQ